MKNTSDYKNYITLKSFKLQENAPKKFKTQICIKYFKTKIKLFKKTINSMKQKLQFQLTKPKTFC